MTQLSACWRNSRHQHYQQFRSGGASGSRTDDHGLPHVSVVQVPTTQVCATRSLLLRFLFWFHFGDVLIEIIICNCSGTRIYSCLSKVSLTGTNDNTVSYLFDLRIQITTEQLIVRCSAYVNIAIKCSDTNWNDWSYFKILIQNTVLVVKRFFDKFAKNL